MNYKQLSVKVDFFTKATIFSFIIITIVMIFSDHEIVTLTASAVSISLVLFMLNLIKRHKLFTWPWGMLVLGIAMKSVFWVIVVIIWPDVNPMESKWPATGNIYYIFDFIGTLFILIYAQKIIKFEISRSFHHGIIADATLIYIAILLVVSILFYDDFFHYLKSVTIDTAVVKLQIFPLIYYMFVIIIIIINTLSSLSIKSLFLFGVMFYTTHLFVEAYANHIIVAQEDYNFFSHFSRFFSDMATLILLIYTLHFVFHEPNVKKSKHLFNIEEVIRVSPIVWFSTVLMLVAPISAIFINYFFELNVLPNQFEQMILFTSGLAIFVRTLMLINDGVKQQELLEYEANIDTLTAINNRRGFIKNLNQYLNDIFVLEHDRPIHFCLADINKFKGINDSYGHDVGDEVLIKLASKINGHANVILSGRLGGDEFVFLLKTKKDHINDFALLQKHLKFLFDVKEQRVEAGVSIGAVQIHEDDDFHSLYSAADNALYKAKTIYSGCFLSSSLAKMSNAVLLSEVSDSIERKAFAAEFQPIFSMVDHSIRFVEILMRIKNSHDDILYPAEFISVAKEHDLIKALTLGLIDIAFKKGQEFPGVVFSINLAPSLLENAEDFSAIEYKLISNVCLSQYLILEVTGQINNSNAFMRNIHRLKAIGFKIVMDDYSASELLLNRFAKVNFDMIKIDMALLREAERGSSTSLENIVLLCERLGIPSIAEGVESQRQMTLLKDLNVSMAQGFYLSKLLNDKELDSLLNASAAQ